MDRKQHQNLLSKYLAGTCTEEEKGIVEQWHLAELAKRSFVPPEEELGTASVNIWKKIQAAKVGDTASLQERAKVKHRSFNLYKYAAAAIILIVGGLGFYMRSQNGERAVPSAQAMADTAVINPGSAKATLLLADGSRITLNPEQRGVITAQGDAKVSQDQKGVLQYTAENYQQPSDSAPVYHQIATPRGGTYQVLLSDGTKVWLNASSSIHFPTAFAANRRHIVIEGEAYLEVAKEADRPFSIQVGQQVIQVLGTDLNIEAYTDQQTIKTTLVRGKVRVDQGAGSLLLMPGEQSTYDKLEGQLTKQPVAVEAAIAWKNNMFLFDSEYVEDIMQKIARWYNVEVTYEGNIKRKRFAGEISRFSNVQDVLQIMELTGTIHFTLEGRRIIVRP